jgi:hypothetical protein
VKNKIKTTVVARTDERFVFAKNKGIERASVFPASNSNGDAVLVALPLDNNNFGRNRFHLGFLGLTSPELGSVFETSGTERHRRRGESERDSHRSPIKSELFREVLCYNEQSFSGPEDARNTTMGDFSGRP